MKHNLQHIDDLRMNGHNSKLVFVVLVELFIEDGEGHGQKTVAINCAIESTNLAAPFLDHNPNLNNKTQHNPKPYPNTKPQPNPNPNFTTWELSKPCTKLGLVTPICAN